MKLHTAGKSKTRKARARRGREAFTLIEVLLVVVIIGILVGIAMPKLSKRVGQSQVAAARASIANVATAVDLYEVDNGVYPASLQNLITQGSEMNWHGPYLKDGKLPSDPWGVPFGYTAKDNGYELRSAGPDAQMGTGDDITN